MIKPVAARLRQLIEAFPERSSYSLLITGHSAGGAVASLLYSHMLSITRAAESELSILAGCFKRIHCVTFGAPPISTFPLTKPDDPALKKSLFFAFINEGDPIARAHPTYLRSLIDLYAKAAPKSPYAQPLTAEKKQTSSLSLTALGSKSTSSLSVNLIRPTAKKALTAPTPIKAPDWTVPDLVFSNSGRLILLRGVEVKAAPSTGKTKLQEKMDEGVVAQIISDAMLREVIWGDPILHMMSLYTRRIEVLATNAVTGRGRGE